MARSGLSPSLGLPRGLEGEVRSGNETLISGTRGILERCEMLWREGAHLCDLQDVIPVEESLPKAGPSRNSDFISKR